MSPWQPFCTRVWVVGWAKRLSPTCGAPGARSARACSFWTDWSRPEAYLKIRTGSEASGILIAAAAAAFKWGWLIDFHPSVDKEGVGLSTTTSTPAYLQSCKQADRWRGEEVTPQ